MKALYRLLLVTVLVAPAANAVKIPLPIEGASLNLTFQLQTEAVINENGNSAGTDPSYDLYIRRSRLLINGDLSPNFQYLIQIDNPNYGKFGNYTGRALIQDAWFGWAPTGVTGGTVVFVDAGLLLTPISHQLLTSTTNYITADNNTDIIRGLQAGSFPGFRDVGIQVRGWALDKKIGWRGGVYEGVHANSNAAGDRRLNPKSTPRLAGFVNLDLIGSEEGGWLYGAQRWNKDMVLSVSGSAIYQSLAIIGPNGATDQKLFSAGAYLNLPQTEAAELVAEVLGYLSSVGSGSRDTGKGFLASVGYRFGFIKPYFQYSQFDADDCDTTLPAAQCGAHLADTREIRAGLDFFINKNLNHINFEFGVNHGQSSYGAQSVTPIPITMATTSAGTTLDTSLRKAATKSFLVHWNINF